MGIAVIGGLVCGGALTLFVIPAMYVLLAKREAKSEPAVVQDAATVNA
jgi:Cu/Ag efflux pump CusA